MRRRKFINTASTIGLSFAAGYGTNALLRQKGIESILGEEWRNDRQVNPADLNNLDSDEAILAKTNANIEKHRKMNASLRFLDQNGQAIGYQKVDVQQSDHEIDWGIAFGQTNASLGNPVHQKTGTLMADLFNCVTAKCYWNERWHQPIEKHEGLRIYDLFKEEIAWGHQNNMRVKGHPLVWTVEKAIPSWVFKYPYERQLDFLKQHVQGLIQASDGKVTRWDLCNEMLWEPAFKNIAQRHWPHIDPIEDIADYIATALQWARAIDPQAIYSLNDYGLVLSFVKEISAGDQRNRYLQLIEALRKRNALPDAVGVQGHIGGKFPLAAFQRCLDHLSESQLPLQVTEFWSKNQDFPEKLTPQERETKMAEYIENIYKIAFAHPKVTHFTFWGRSQFFTENGDPKKTYEVLYELIRNQWLTKTQKETNEEGIISFTGFKGDYLLKIAGQEISLNLNESIEKTITLTN